MTSRKDGKRKEERSETKDKTEFMKFLEPEILKFSRGKDGILRMAKARAKPQSVRLRPLFPLSRPSTWISVVADASSADKEEEIGVLRDLEGLSEDSQALLREELARSFFLPVITEVKKIEASLGVMTWTVVTNLGPRVFRVPDRDQIRFMPIPGGGLKLLIRDDNNDRYLIENFNNLDAISQDVLEVEL